MPDSQGPSESPPLDDFHTGLLLGVLIGEGHFGGDGKQPQITLRMHVRHQRLFELLLRLCPGSRLYGPYHHGQRHYFQWMVRGPHLREGLLPLLDRLPLKQIDDAVYARYSEMKQRYGL